ncbi:polyprenol phosphomannose-dependent alpha 1,6 mannosyltransferase MptB [Planosporangium flavigriseum]|nr:polyprenol phosphomannose-dependent alpha 1,6 mannosyltransferase MptB [Planosporangium flavigriseum]NJC65298.1 polyprenol phosphomannose-dependent alpha 1,6 mannosyltransferase MptB [Planosporangium flavigriseum]
MPIQPNAESHCREDDPAGQPARRSARSAVVARYAGLAATTLMALLSWSVGALPWQQPHQLAAGAPMLPGLVWHRVGLGLWLVAMAVLVAAWWVLGREVRHRRVTPRAVIVTAALWAVPLLVAAPLASHDVYSYACQGQAYLAGADPYRVGPSALPCRWLTAVPPIWRGQPAPYGPVAVLVAAAAAHGSLLGAVAMLRFAAVAGLVLLAIGLPALAARCGARPATALWLGLANPVVLVHLVGGAHHDALTAGLVVAGLALVAGGRAVPGAAVVGVAVAVKATAVVVLPFAVLLAVVASRSASTRTVGHRWVRAMLAVGAAAAAAFTALTLAAGLDLGWTAALPVSHQPVSWMSPPSAVGAVVGAVVGGFSLSGVPASVEVARAVALYGALPAVLLALWWWAARSGNLRAVTAAAGAALAATVVLAPVVYPWYVVTPAAVLAAAASGRVVRAVAVVVGVLSFVVLPNSLNLAIVTRWPGVIAEVVALLALAVWAISRSRAASMGRTRQEAGASAVKR